MCNNAQCYSCKNANIQLLFLIYYNLKIIIFFICIYVYFILKLLLSERFAVALLLAVPIDLKKSLQTTNVYILLCNFFLCQRSNKYYLSIYLSYYQNNCNHLGLKF